MAFNFLTGQPLGQASQMGQANPSLLQNSPQLQQLLQAAQQQSQGANVAQWAQNPQIPSQQSQAQLAGIQTQPGYAQNPLSNQGANGFSLGDYLARAQSNGLNLNQALGGLQMMLQGWGSRS